MTNSNPNTPKLELLHPSQDLYPDLGAFALDTMEDMVSTYVDQFNEMFALSFTMAYFNVSTDKEIKSKAGLIDFSHVYQALKPLLGLYIYSVVSKETKAQFKQGLPFEQIAELEPIIRGIVTQLENTDTGVVFWQNLFISINKYQTLVTKKHTEFMEGSTNSYLQTFKSEIVKAVSAKTANEFRELFERGQEFNPNPTIQLHKQHHPVVAESLSNIATTYNPEQILQSVRMLKVLKYIHPDLEVFTEVFKTIQSEFQPSYLQEFNGHFHLRNAVLSSFAEHEAVHQILQFILFTKPNTQLISTQPFSLGGLTLEPSQVIEDQLFISESSIAHQLRCFNQVLQTVTELQESQKTSELKNGDKRYPHAPIKMSHHYISDSIDETVGSSVDNYLDLHITQQLATHGLQLHPVTEFYFRSLSKELMLNLTSRFETTKDTQGVMYIFAPQTDAFAQAIEESHYLFHNKLAHLKSTPYKSPLFNEFTSDKITKRIYLRETELMVSPSANYYSRLLEGKTPQEVVDNFDRMIDSTKSIKDGFDDLVASATQVFDINSILVDILTNFDVNKDLETISGCLIYINNLSNQQMVDLYTLNPAGVVATLQKLVTEMDELADAAVIIELINIAHAQKDITTRKKNQLIKEIKRKNSLLENPESLERGSSAFVVNPANLQGLIDTIKTNAFYYSLIKISKAKKLTKPNVESIAYILDQLDQPRLVEFTFQCLLDSNSLQAFTRVLVLSYSSSVSENLLIDFVEIIAEKLGSNKDLYAFVSKLDVEIIKSMYGIQNSLPSDVQEFIEHKMETLFAENPLLKVNLNDILIKLTSHIKSRSHNESIKTLLDQ